MIIYKEKNLLQFVNDPKLPDLVKLVISVIGLLLPGIQRFTAFIADKNIITLIASI